MRRKTFLPLILILVAAYGGLLATLLSGNSPELGLDLQGGVSVVLAPTGDASGDQLDQALEIIRDRVDALGVAEPDITRQGDAIVVQLPGVKNRDRALALVGQTAELRFRPVLAQAQFSEGAVADAQEAADAQVGATTTTTAPGATTTTTVPGAPTDTTTTTAADPSASEGAWGAGGGTTALVEGESAAGPTQDPPATTTTAPSTTTTAPTDPTATTVPAETPEQQEVPPLTPRDQDVADQQVVLAGADGTTVYQLGPALATGRIVKTASADIQNGQWLVRLEMRGGEDGIDKFNEIAAACYAQSPDPQVCPSGQLAIVLDSVVQSAPTIQQPSYEADQIQISGSFTESEAKDLALVLRYGSLPVELERQSVQTVSASLGDDSLRAGIIAGIVGLTLVVGYCFWYYRGLGIVVVASLGIAAILTYACVVLLGSSVGFALNLPGIAGIIVAIGITADSFVIFFERIRDEVREGRSLRTAVETGWRRARQTILIADTVSLLSALVLFVLAIGSVKGFAFTLGLTTLIDVVVVFLFTKPLMTLLARTRFFGGGHKLSGLDPEHLGVQALPGSRSRRPVVARPAAVSEEVA
jgi:preprotein translocase subunit SecD